MSDAADLPLAAPCLVRHTLNGLRGQPPRLQLAVLVAALAWVVVNRFLVAERAPLLIRLAHRLASQASLLDAQTPGRAG